MDPRDFVDLAATMAVASPGGPARYRTSISRAYYGAFHRVSQALDELDAPAGRGPTAHGRASLLLQRSGDPPLVAAGQLLQSLHSLRIIADYALEPRPVVETRANAMKAAEDARRVVSTIDELMSDEDRRDQAAATMRSVYEGITGSAPPPPRPAEPGG